LPSYHKYTSIFVTSFGIHNKKEELIDSFFKPQMATSDQLFSTRIVPSFGLGLESLSELLQGLSQLDNLVGQVFTKISGRVQEEHQKIEHLTERIQTCQHKIDKIAKERASVATVVCSPAKFPDVGSSHSELPRLWMNDDDDQLVAETRGPKASIQRIKTAESSSSKPKSLIDEEIWLSFDKEKKAVDVEMLVDLKRHRLPTGCKISSVSDLLVFNSGRDAYKYCSWGSELQVEEDYGHEASSMLLPKRKTPLPSAEEKLSLLAPPPSVEGILQEETVLHTLGEGYVPVMEAVSTPNTPANLPDLTHYAHDLVFRDILLPDFTSSDLFPSRVIVGPQSPSSSEGGDVVLKLPRVEEEEDNEEEESSLVGPSRVRKANNSEMAVADKVEAVEERELPPLRPEEKEQDQAHPLGKVEDDAECRTEEEATLSEPPLQVKNMAVQEERKAEEEEEECKSTGPGSTSTTSSTSSSSPRGRRPPLRRVDNRTRQPRVPPDEGTGTMGDWIRRKVESLRPSFAPDEEEEENTEEEEEWMDLPHPNLLE